MTNDLLVVGAGAMAAAYVRVLREMGIGFDVVGRGGTSAKKLRDELGVGVRTGGLENYLSRAPAPISAIVAVPVEQLAANTQLLAHAGTKRILVEKPGALNASELHTLITSISSTQAKVWVAYNRRFFQSVLTAQNMIQEDGGVTSFSFEFSEWVNRVLSSPADPRVKEAWVVANSSHVIDLAFYLGGMPTELASWTCGSLPWHHSGDRFSGAGVSDTGALFSFRSDWLSPGRWRVEVNTRKRRLLLLPLEELQVMVHDSLGFEAVELDDDLDRRFKPGIYRQTRSFVEGTFDGLCSLDDHLLRMRLYEQVAGYSAKPYH